MKDKKSYLEKLRQILEDHDVIEEDIADVINDYDALYTDALASKTDEEVWEMLGDPSRVWRQIKSTVKRTYRSDIKENITGVVALLSITAYLLVGFLLGAWHPGWLILLAIPLYAVTNFRKLRSSLAPMMVFISTIVFVLVGYFTGVYNPTWVVFLSIILASLLNEKKKVWWVTLLNVVILLGVIVAYVLLYQEPLYALLFFIPLITLTTGGFIQISFGFDWMDFPKSKKYIYDSILMSFTIIVAITLFLVLGLVYGFWSWSWLFFFLIPLVAMAFIGKVTSLNAYMPFLTTIAYILIGTLLGIWHPTWLIFMLIPITGAISGVIKPSSKTAFVGDEEFDLEDLGDIIDEISDQVDELGDYIDNLGERIEKKFD